MEDTNLIARLFPADGEGYAWALQAILMSENRSRYIPPQGETERPHHGSRESTASLEDEEDEVTSDTSAPGLQLTFNPGPKGSRGLEFGTNLNCDIVLPELEKNKISRVHCALTFDDQRRLILRDFSKHGTVVEYDRKGGESRRTIVTKDDRGRETYHHFKWILGGHKVPRDTKKIVIEIQGIGFRIDVSTHDENPRLYNANVDRFLQQAKANDQLPLGRFSIQSLPSTAAPSGAHTPNQSPIRLKQETLGKGAFAVVRRYWDVSTGIEYAYKEPLDKRRFHLELWEKEADIMRQISHDNVVSLIESTFTPSPRLVLEYVPCGSLEGSELSLEETMTVLCQGLSALADLHGREVPIVHRDIKPANILLQSRDPLHIKLTDFGLSRASNDLTTFCGTPLYLAPEVYKKRSYTPAVDIWSLGVVAFECAYDLPNSRGYQGKDWCEMLVDQVNDWENGDLIDLLSNAMIVMDPRSRHTARDCYKEASRLTIASYERCLTPTPSSYGYKPVTYYPAEVGDGSLHTLSNVNSSQHEDSTSSFHPSDVRYIRSDAPPPSGAPTIIANSNSSHQHMQSVPGIDLFGGDWLQDPNCVGSSVAAMGRELSDLSSWENWETEPSGRYIPRSIPEPVYEQKEYYDPPLGSGGCQTNSEDYMAAHLLYAINQGEGS